MNIAVIAANGRSGQAFVEHALSQGHHIRAGVFGPVNSIKPHEHLDIFQCDATKLEDITNLIQGQDAVVSFIGHVKGSPPHVQTDAMRTLVSAMTTLNLKRIVSLTGTGVRFADDRIPLIDYLLNISIRLIDPARVNDGRDHVQVLKESRLDWTVIRVLKLQNIPAKPFKLTSHGPTKWVVCREEVARAVLQVLEQDSFIRQAPIISKA